jgi:hypothetical protein
MRRRPWSDGQITTQRSGGECALPPADRRRSLAGAAQLEETEGDRLGQVAEVGEHFAA